MSRCGSIVIAVAGLLASCSSAVTHTTPTPTCQVRVRVPRDPGLDQDLDGLSDLTELSLGTDPLNPDSDDDGQPDGIEQRGWGTSPLLIDSDGDGASDGAELFSRHTDPLLYDPPAEGTRPKAAPSGPSKGPNISLPPQSPIQPVHPPTTAGGAPRPSISSALTRAAPATTPGPAVSEGDAWTLPLPSSASPDLVSWQDHLCTTLPGPELLCLDATTGTPALHASLDVVPERADDLPPPTSARLYSHGPHLVSVTDTGVVTGWSPEGAQWALHTPSPVRSVHLRHVLLLLTTEHALLVRLSPASVELIESPALATWDHAVLTGSGLWGWQDASATLLATSAARSGFRERTVHRLLSDARFLGSPWVQDDLTSRWSTTGQLWAYRNSGPVSMRSPLGLHQPLDAARRAGAGWWLQSGHRSWYLPDEGLLEELPGEALAAAGAPDGRLWIRSQTALFQRRPPVVATLP